MDRVIALVDMDCFYVQVEQRLNPELKGKPVAVVQYNPFKGGGLLAISYEARARGVTRFMRGDDARKVCPEILLPQVPELRKKANLTRYRDAGAEVIAVMKQFVQRVERASVDEAFLDITDEVDARMKAISLDADVAENLANTHIVGWQIGEGGFTDRISAVRDWLMSLSDSAGTSANDQRLAVGAILVEEMRAAILRQTGFTCSAGVAHNKVLAKLCAGMNKPNKQTVLPHTSVGELFAALPINKLRHLGGKFGDGIQAELGVEFVGDLTKFSLSALQQHCGEKSGSWLYEMCRGREHGAVKDRLITNSIGCSKNFLGREKLDTKDKVLHWLEELSSELEERLTEDQEKNNRLARHLTVGIRMNTNPSSSATRSGAIASYSAKKIARSAYQLLEKFNTAPANSGAWTPAALNLHILAGKFQDCDDSANDITKFMRLHADRLVSVSDSFSSAATSLRSPRSNPMSSQLDYYTAIRSGTKTNASCTVTSLNETTSVLDHDPNGIVSSSLSEKPSTAVPERQKKSFFDRYAQSAKTFDKVDNLPKEPNKSSYIAIDNAPSETLPYADSENNNFRNFGDFSSIPKKSVKTKPFFDKYMDEKQLRNPTLHRNDQLADDGHCSSDFSVAENSVVPFPVLTEEASRDSAYSDSDVEQFEESALESLPADIRAEIDQFRRRLAEGARNRGRSHKKQSGLLNFFVKSERMDETSRDADDCSSNFDRKKPVQTINESECTPDAEGINSKDFNSEIGSVETTRCNECGRDISVWDVFEHSDFHVALALQDKISPSAPKAKPLPSPAKPAKRKQSDTPKGKKTKIAKTSLHNFFQ